MNHVRSLTNQTVLRIIGMDVKVLSHVEKMKATAYRLSLSG